MRWSWQVTHINGAPVQVNWLFAPLVAWTAFVGWSQGRIVGMAYSTSLLAAMFACILLHEIGHTLQAQAVGIPVRRIVLMPVGGLAQLARAPRRPSDELRVAMAGPLVNLGLTLIVGGLWLEWFAASNAPVSSLSRVLLAVVRGAPGGLQFFATLTVVNLGLLALNAIPAFPLDGGRIVRSALALMMSRRAATQVVARLGWVLGALCLLSATTAARLWGEPFAISLLFTGIAAILGAGAEESFERGQSALQAIPVRAAVRQPTWCLQPAERLTPSLLEAIESLNRPAFPVVNEARLVGVVTRLELSSARAQAGSLTVGHIMRTDFMHVDAEAALWRAQQIMLGAGQDALPVLDGERLHGMLTSADIRAATLVPPSRVQGEAPQLISPAQSNL